ncbi:hypothetical protein GLOTRDRAFT_110653, partial [Gloeophyllum trabeum ATCC 11539]
MSTSLHCLDAPAPPAASLPGVGAAAHVTGVIAYKQSQTHHPGSSSTAISPPFPISISPSPARISISPSLARIPLPPPASPVPLS